MDLSNLDLELFYNDVIPLREILEGSAYYPACFDDYYPLNFCISEWGHLGINSFVYCDFAFTAKDVKRNALHDIPGYKKIAERWLHDYEYIPADWKLNLYGTPQEKYKDRRFGEGPAVTPFGVWRIYERKRNRNDSFGPKRLSFLFICGEGLATYQQLYYCNSVSPKILFFVQYYDMIGPADDWESPECAFQQTLRDGTRCTPKFIVQGCHGRVENPIPYEVYRTRHSKG